MLQVKALQKFQKIFNDALADFLSEQKAMREKYNVQCTFTKEIGKVVIRKITEAFQNKNVVVIFYDFIYDNPSAATTKFPESNTNKILTIESGSSTKAWVDKNNIKVRTELKAIREEIIPKEYTQYCNQVRFFFLIVLIVLSMNSKLYFSFFLPMLFNA